ncbi:MAG: C-GCAxxG-C-C family protein [Bacillota bacterium]|jgi:C_GCAxxG_C_C family probable redox protein
MSEAALAREFYEQKYNCAEAAWLGMSGHLSQAERDLGLKLMGGFGGGVASGGLCGALAGAIAGLGLYLGRTMGEPRADQLRTVTKQLVEAFQAKYGSMNCCDIKPAGDDYRATCAGYVEFCVETAIQLLDEALDADDDGDCG